mmetsp:Transcript_35947/g.83489  ORF Transcript_35947/g.83489 Transcript_35947/m.83489 type:complete len:165 (+) Transcript_35947:3-497(+)
MMDEDSTGSGRPPSASDANPSVKLQVVVKAYRELQKKHRTLEDQCKVLETDLQETKAQRDQLQLERDAFFRQFEATHTVPSERSRAEAPELMSKQAWPPLTLPPLLGDESEAKTGARATTGPQVSAEEVAGYKQQILDLEEQLRLKSEEGTRLSKMLEFAGVKK